MFKKQNIDLLEYQLKSKTQENINSFQDNLNWGGNNKFNPIIITKKEQDFIIKNNLLFYKEFQKAYIKNIELKKKLSEINYEKNRLKETIDIIEQKLKYSNKINNKEINKNNGFINNNEKKIVSYYDKRKRIRRKKTEIINKYNCTFPDCNKSYPTNSSLRMHIKLKHL